MNRSLLSKLDDLTLLDDLARLGDGVRPYSSLKEMTSSSSSLSAVQPLRILGADDSDVSRSDAFEQSDLLARLKYDGIYAYANAPSASSAPSMVASAPQPSANESSLKVLDPEATAVPASVAEPSGEISRVSITGFDGKPSSEFIIYPDFEGVYKGANPIAAPTSVNELSAPIGDLGTISFAPNGSVDGFIIDDSSFDVYAINLNAGETWTFSVYGSGGTPLDDSVVYLFDTNGDFVTLDDDGGAGRYSLLNYTATTSGTHYVAVSNFPGLGELSGGYTLDVVQQPATDVVPDTFGGAEAVGLGVTYGFIDGDGPNYLASFLGEIDTYSLQVEAGKIYTIEIAGGADYDSDYSALVDELDPLLVVWDSNGNLVSLNDDISFPDDINSRASFFAQESGTYYFDVMSYDPWVGGFSITIQEFDPADFDPLDSIIWESADNVVPNGDNTLYVYFGDSDENFGQVGDDGVSPMITIDWNQYEKDQVMASLEEYTKILGFDYEVTDDVNEATFKLLKTESTQYGAYFYPQDPAFGPDQGVGVFNVLSGGWSFDQQQSLMQGGFSWAVVLHEFGHAHGLSHPHDTGGGSEVMLGVTASTGSLGLYDLNQGVYTVMSYNDAWETHPDGPTPYTAANIDSGWSGTLSAFDIAALQQRYGIINDHASGNDTYLLGDVNDPGTYYETIWDTGGVDKIQYDGARDARIDLLAATIDYTPTGGGVVSFVDDIWGGYTIAEGVVIENGVGGSGNDGILGNESNNHLSGRAGDDTLMGREGADTLDGGAGNDTATYMDADGGVAASLWLGWGWEGDANGDRFSSIENLQGGAYDDTLYGDNYENVLDGLGGDDNLSGGNKADTLLGGEGNDSLYGENHADVLDGGEGDDYLDGGNHTDMLYGGDGNDTLDGGLQRDTLNGGAGDDYLIGGKQNDVFEFTDLGDVDEIADFDRGRDSIDVSGLGVSDWIGSNTFSGSAGEIRAFKSGGDYFVEGDVDGDGAADFTIITNVLVHQSDFIFA